MADVLGAASAADSLLGTAIKLISNARDAYKAKKDETKLLENYKQELASTREAVAVVKRQKALQISNVASELQRLSGATERLQEWLREREKLGDKNSAKQYSHHLFRGSEDKKRLAAIMQELSRYKSNLGLFVQAATASNMCTFEKTVMKRIDTIPGSHTSIKRRSRDSSSSRITAPCSDIAKTVTRQGTTSSHNCSESSSLGSDSGIGLSRASTNPSTFVERVVKNNTAKAWAVQINTQVGDEDLGSHINSMIIANNVAEEDSTQFNYPMSSKVADGFMAQRELALRSRYSHGK